MLVLPNLPFLTLDNCQHIMNRDCTGGALIAVIYNVAQLLRKGVGAERQYAISGFLSRVDENNPGGRAISGSVRLVRTPKGILVTGNAKLALGMVCRRCLEVFDGEIAFDFEEEFIASVDLLTGASLPVAEDEDPSLILTEQHILDLTEVLRQYAVLTATLEGLCSPDCRGLCPGCGQNLNMGDCECGRARGDPRFSALAQLLRPDIDN